MPISAAARTPPHMLVVDDDPLLGEFLVEVAQLVGYRCTLVTTRTQLQWALEPEIVLILLDLTLPDIHGDEVLQILWERDYAGAIVLMSGVDQSRLAAANARGTALGLRMLPHMQKPFRLAEVQAVLQSSLPDDPTRGG